MAPFVADAQTSEHQIGTVSGLRVSNGAGFRGAARAEHRIEPLNASTRPGTHCSLAIPQLVHSCINRTETQRKIKRRAIS